MKRIWTGVLAAVLMVAGAAHAGIQYVDAAATGMAYGDTWADAYTTLDNALYYSKSGDQIWVAKGVYKPATTDGWGVATSPSPIKNDISIYGGFESGMGSITQRNWKVNLTVLSGDLGNDDAAGFSNRNDNALHLFVIASVRNTWLDGFVLRGGCANSDTNPATTDSQGGAIRLENATGFVAKNCTFVDNEAWAGGAVYTRELPSAALFEDCVFSGNLSLDNSVDGSGGGGAFASRRASGSGNPAVQVLLNRCTFTGNRAPDSRGGVFRALTLNTSKVSANITNSLFVGNEANTNWTGGAFYFQNSEQSSLMMNSTFYGNYPDAVVVQSATNVMVNSIVWGNASDLAVIGTGEFQVSYSDVGKARYGTNSLTHNINQEPLFVYTESGTWSAAAAYNKLTGQTVLTNASANWANNVHAGRTVCVNTNQVAQFAVFTNSAKSLTVWGDATAGGQGVGYTIYDFNLASNSPCLSVATSNNAPAVDIKMTSRPQGLGYDMGAFEFIGTEAPPPTNPPPAGNSIWYVNGSASGANNGTNWASAFTTVTAAFQNYNLQSGDQIWVAQGVYKPFAGRTNSFNVPTRVQIYGGYIAGTTNRNWKTNLTVLSGDVDSNDTANFAGRTNNAYHVLYAGYIKDSLLDGFVIRGGYADDSSLNGNGQGGGLYVENSSNITVRYCAFVDNAASAGGALFTRDLNSSLVVDDCVFSGNLALNEIDTSNGGGGAVAGRRAIGTTTQPAVQMVGNRCVFTANKAPYTRGGVLYSTAIKTGTNLNSYTANFINSLFAGNSAGTNNNGGGALYYRDSESSPVQMNSTFVDNFPDAIITQSSTNILINSIVWNNGGDLTSVNTGGMHDVTYTDTSKYKFGTNSLSHNLDSDPLFVYTESGNWSGNAAYNASLGVTVLTNASAIWTVNAHSGRTVKLTGDPRPHFYILANGVKSLTVWGDASAGVLASAYTIYDFNLASNSPCLSVATSNNAPAVDIKMTSRPQGLGYDMGAFEFVGTEAPPVTNPPPGSGIWYVDTSATGANNGLAWGSAFTNLQSALANPDLATSNEIWVAQGVYRPGTNRLDMFGLHNRVAVYGGFTNNMADRASRDWKLYRTVLSGDLDKNDTANFGSRAGNAYHVVDASYSVQAVLDGFIVCSGYADGTTPADRGGALYAEGSSNLVVRNCSFSDNAAVGGGAVFISEAKSTVLFQGCVFGGNMATENTNDLGGGAICGLRKDASSATSLFVADRCVFAGNRAPNSRGGVFNTPTLSSSQVSGHFTNCLVVGNSASVTGGGGAFYLKAILDRININSCTFAGNYPDAFTIRQATNSLINTIVWSNSPNEIGGYDLADVRMNVRNCDINISALTNPPTCIQANPMWQSSTGTWSGAPVYDRNSGMTMLQGSGWTAKALIGSAVQVDTNSPAQYYIVDNTTSSLTVLGDATAGSSGKRYVICNYHLVNGSPCQNSGYASGAPGVDLDGVSRPQETGYDMGAYEYKSAGTIPSWWWALYPSIAQVELADPDGDGQDNLSEYIAGTDPTVKSSVFEIGDAEGSTNSLNILRWLSISNRVYSVQIGSTVGSTFTSLVTSLGATPPMNTYTDVVVRPNPTFYRVGVNLLP